MTGWGLTEDQARQMEMAVASEIHAAVKEIMRDGKPIIDAVRSMSRRGYSPQEIERAMARSLEHMMRQRREDLGNV